MPKITTNNKIIRSKRRTIALSVTADATLVVRAPLHTPAEYIEDFVAKHTQWITRKVAEVMNQPKKSAKQFVDGEEFLYLGQTYRLQISNGHKIILYDKLFFPQSQMINAREVLASWYQEQAEDVIGKRVAALARQMNLQYSTIKISKALHRWGSCSARGNLNFTWRLMMAPIEVIDYVIVHELVHLTEKNHSARFWMKVKLVVPDYKSRHKWLKNNDYLLHF